MIIHPVLRRQLKRLNLNDDQVPKIKQWQAFLNSVERFYADADQSRYLNETSIQISSREMLEINQNLIKTIEELKKTQQQLIQSEKMATVGQLSAGVAHEINNPLTYAMNNLDTLHRRLMILLQLLKLYNELMTKSQNENANEATDEMNIFTKEKNIDNIIADFDPIINETKNGLLRIKEIVKNLEKFASTHKIEMTSIDVNLGLSQAIETVQSKSKHALSIVSHLENLPTISGISNELKLVFNNVLTNASQAITHDGVIDVRSSHTDSHIVITISDNGCGISADDLPKIFTPFFTTKPIGTAMGLGLAIAYGIVELHGGYIDAKSTLSLGTQVTISLPIKKSM
jgi:two-component system NtrC family sensor kinase